jgi:hypothetical protein
MDAFILNEFMRLEWFYTYYDLYLLLFANFETRFHSKDYKLKEYLSKNILLIFFILLAQYAYILALNFNDFSKFYCI